MKKLEKEIRKVFKRFQTIRPKLHHLTFEITTYEHSGKTIIYGFYHIAPGCTSFDSLEELDCFITKQEILYKKFT